MSGSDPSFVTHYSVPTKSITSLCFHPNGKRLLVSSRVGGCLLYNIEKQNRPFAFQAKGFSPIRSLFGVNSDDHDYSIYGASIEGRIALWQVHKNTASLVKTAHPSRINDMDIWKENGVIITCSNDKSVKLWSPSLDFITSFPGHNSQVTACACCPTSDVILSGDNSGTLTLWDVRDKGKLPMWTSSVSVHGRNSVVSVAFDHTGVLFCTSTEDGTLSVWDRRAPEHPLEEEEEDQEFVDLIQSHKVPPCKALFHPRKPMILTAGTDDTPKIFDLEMSSHLYSFEGHDKPNCSCAWAPNGRTFATADSDGVVIVWKLPKSKIVPTVLSRVEQVSIEPCMPPPTTLSAEVLLDEIELMTMHARKLNDHLRAQEERLAILVDQYPSVSGATYEC